MQSKYKPTLTLSLRDDQKDRIREIAEGFGLLIERGAMADSGSIQKLISEIADGRLIVMQSDILVLAKKMGLPIGEPDEQQ